MPNSEPELDSVARKTVLIDSRTISNAIGWTSIALVVISVLAAFADPVPGIFVLFLAIILGGMSGVGVDASPRFGIFTIILALLLAVIGTHSSYTEIQPLELRLVWTAVQLVGVPVVVSVALLVLGIFSRRIANKAQTQ
jgi:hypothetical protein